MTRYASPRLRFYLLVGVFSMVGGFAVGSSALIALSAPFLLMSAVGLLWVRDSAVMIGATFEEDRAIEGDEIRLVLRVDSDGRAMVSVSVDLPPGLSIKPVQDDPAILVAFEDGVTVRGSHARVDVTFVCDRWGSYRPAWVRATSREGTLFVQTKTFSVDLELRVYPDVETLRRLFEPVETQLGFGDLVSRRKGDGLEFADLRPFAPGDDFRRVNWRVTASGRGIWTNDRHPERNSDVVLLVDTLALSRRGVPGVFDLAVKAAAAIAAAHLVRHDRVGLISFGEPIRWIEAGMGDVQRYRILDTLMESHVRRQLLWRGVRVVPPHALPPQALVVGITPLLDERSISALSELRGRGFDVRILEVTPEESVAGSESRTGDLARRIWLLEREATRSRFARHGIPLVSWEPGTSLQAALVAIERHERGARRA
ncbi:MAG: DUF58 domain-containing protein [Acidimicrobiia bacterium]